MKPLHSVYIVCSDPGNKRFAPGRQSGRVPALRARLPKGRFKLRSEEKSDQSTTPGTNGHGGNGNNNLGGGRLLARVARSLHVIVEGPLLISRSPNLEKKSSIASPTAETE
jgi:hypothetical protein